MEGGRERVSQPFPRDWLSQFLGMSNLEFELLELVMDREAWLLRFMGSQRVGPD